MPKNPKEITKQRTFLKKFVDGRTDIHTDERTIPMDGQIYGRTDGRIYIRADGHTYGRTYINTDGQTY